jgi:ATP-dependent helicase/DNAse subunit B
VQLIEAPGTVGEARLVARAVRQLLAQNVVPRAIVVTARHPDRTRAVFREVFDEHGIPCEWAGSEPLARHPGVAFLLRAWPLPEEDFPFAAVAALLRSTWFNPDWAEAELPLRAEALLRVVGEPRGREAFLAAVRGWCDTPPVALEDEQAEEPRRRRVQRLARECRPFLERFFRLWDRLPRTGRAAAFAGWLAAFATDIGLTPDDDAAWPRFWDELHRWAATSKGRLTRSQFGHALTTLASHTPLPPAAPRCDAVRILSPEDARLIECDYLFLTGLGEGSFPDAAAPDSLLTDADRERLRAAGVALPDPAARLSEEMLLFAQLVCRPRARLVLSYPAVDERGESLLPSSFLTAVRECFAPDAIPVTRRKMLIEGYATEEPASSAEVRVRVARELAHADGDAVSDNALTPDLLRNLLAARAAARHRFRDRDFGPFDGSLRHPAIARDLAERFGPAKVFSPTALEAYVACPFRFWLEHVLRLEPLDDPGEEVEHTRRGAAVHRALSRLHAALRESAVPLHHPELPESLNADFTARIEQAVEEYVARAPSAASRELWRLEARRLRRAADKYRRHWQTFRDPWHKPGAVPVPHSFEAGFGLPAEDGRDPAPPLVIDVNGVEVRIGGRIDRVDVAELADGVGFWVIDYKTGRGQNYTPADIAAFRKLQLPLYAVAVERVLLKDRPARPLGLAYWLVTDVGAKGVLPAGAKQVLSWLTDAGRWPKFRAQLEAWVATLATHVRAGDFPLAPRSEHCTDTCPFGPVCRITQSRNTGKLFPLPLPTVAE